MHCRTKSYNCGFRSVCIFLFFIFILLCVLAGGCASDKTSSKSRFMENASAGKKDKLRDAVPVVFVPKASGKVTYGNGDILIDASNTANGYVMLKYTGTNEKVKFQIKTPEAVEYTYLVTEPGEYSVYPLSGGNGSYRFTLLESVSIEDNMYAVAFTQSMEITIADEFSPYLYPNHYVDFSEGSAAVAKGQELAEKCTCDLEVVSNIYNYVISSISYDTSKAESVAYGYTPDVDETLKSGKGICFDYAALMAAMLRSQQIPTKLEVGYAGEAYHAWISCYVEEVGWVDNIIEFDGKNWSLMDPTLAANNDRDYVREYIGDGSGYVIKYTY